MGSIWAVRKETRIGLLAFAVFALVTSGFTLDFAFASGFLVGLAICLLVVGLLPESAYRRLKNLKRSWALRLRQD